VGHMIAVRKFTFRQSFIRYYLNETMIVTAVKTKIFEEGDDLVSFVTKNIKTVRERTIIVITSKIVALSENRTERAGSDSDFEKLVKSESEYAQKTPLVWLTIKDGTVMASAGIDKSNAFGKWILLPRDSFKVARNLRKALSRYYKVKHLGVLITDSRLMPMRVGVTGVALGYAGFKGVRSYIGKRDLSGRALRFSKTNIADSLSGAAVLTMGEGGESQPLALVEKAPVVFTQNDPPRTELYIDPAKDLYRPLLLNLS